jgi:hypothetical protein
MLLILTHGVWIDKEGRDEASGRPARRHPLILRRHSIAPFLSALLNRDSAPAETQG